MAENARSGGSPVLAFIVGGLVVAVAVIGFLVYSGGGGSKPEMPKSVDVDVSLPKPPTMPDAPKMPEPSIPVPK